jgi:UDP-glucose 4-epimerase
VKGEAMTIRWPYGPAEILYGKDAARGTVLAVMKDQFKETLFHIGNGDTLSGDDIVAAVRKVFPRAEIDLLKGNNPMPYPESRLASDFSRAKTELGYEPEYPIEKAVLDYGSTLKKLENL